MQCGRGKSRRTSKKPVRRPRRPKVDVIDANAALMERMKATGVAPTHDAKLAASGE